jgi:hypothetical protein
VIKRRLLFASTFLTSAVCCLLFAVLLFAIYFAEGGFIYVRQGSAKERRREQRQEESENARERFGEATRKSNRQTA